MKKLKAVVLREEYLALTGDAVEAIVLNQFMYWNETMGYFDKILEEEKERAAVSNTEINFEPVEGWIYKSAKELVDEIMMSSVSYVSARINHLVEKGYLERRRNPKYKWDRTWQYRVNLVKLATDLFNLGYPLSGYTLPKEVLYALNQAISSTSKCISSTNKSINLDSKAIPETTTEITIERESTPPPPKDNTETANTQKVQYAEYVHMKEEEYKKLIEQYGEKTAKEYITDLNLWKGSKGKKTASDYLTILNWIRRDEKEGKIKTAPSKPPQPKKREIKFAEE